MNDRVEHDQEAARRAALAAAEVQTYNEVRLATGPLSRLSPEKQVPIIAEILQIVGPEVLKKALKTQLEKAEQEVKQRRRSEQLDEQRKKESALIANWFPRLFPYYGGVPEIRAEVDANLQRETLKNIIRQRDRILKTDAQELGFTPEVRMQALTHLNSIIDVRRVQGETESHSVADSLSLLRKVSNVFRGR